MRTKTLNVKEIKNRLSQKTLSQNSIDLIAKDEIFARVPRYNYYFISNYGRLLHKNFKSGKLKIVRPSIVKGGYFGYNLSKPTRKYRGKKLRDENGKVKGNTSFKYAHRLTALVYVNSQYPDSFSIEEDLQVHHKDENPKNNYYKNLMYLSKNKDGRRDHDLVHTFKKIAFYNQDTTKFHSYSDIELLCKRLKVDILEFLDAIRYADNTLTSQDGKWTMYNINGSFVGIQYYR